MRWTLPHDLWDICDVKGVDNVVVEQPPVTDTPRIGRRVGRDLLGFGFRVRAWVRVRVRARVSVRVRVSLHRGLLLEGKG